MKKIHDTTGDTRNRMGQGKQYEGPSQTLR